MNIKELNKASELVQEINYFKWLIKSGEIAIKVLREDGDWSEYSVFPKGLERRERVNKALNSLCEDLKAELKELGVEYE
ncbi:hypothetical protein SAMN05216470_2049 [Streptococcus equinus]|uniref:Phage protein n=1 Tax=Streptococcus equinus TaxID=1335 RepID=A0A239RGN0_STREI|nr:hypothetical protein [Streptococcus equinus]SNU09834.1 hypothetical protein SAMN05216470_2049 [Streptococcus equinus]